VGDGWPPIFIPTEGDWEDLSKDTSEEPASTEVYQDDEE
jgi:hypothetical protein